MANQTSFGAASPRSFTETEVAGFLESGWMLALDPSRILVGWGKWSESSERQADCCALYAPDFYLQDMRPWKWTTHWDLLDRDRFASLVLTAERSKVNSDVAQSYQDSNFLKNEKLQWVEPDSKKFETVWQEIRLGFAVRALLKAVPVVFSTTHSGVHLDRRIGILKSLIGQPKHLYLYGMWSENAGMIGATPELLFSLISAEHGKVGELTTVALAGTKGKLTESFLGASLDVGAALLVDPKERYEHGLVVNDINEQLMSIGDVTLGPTELLELPTLYHLKTDLRATFTGNIEFADCVRLLHPTPALGVAPRVSGFEEMRRWDNPQFRERFGAPFGVCAPGIQQCVVAIRNVQWDRYQTRLGSGCGIVGESVFDREWQELSLKRESVKRMLNI